MTPTLLLILDGWGIAPPDPQADKGDAPLIAVTPNIDALLKKYSHSRLTASGRAVGLPEGYMGNSEVGHLNIGAGRVVYQDMTRIDIVNARSTILVKLSGIVTLVKPMQSKNAPFPILVTLSGMVTLAKLLQS